MAENMLLSRLEGLDARFEEVSTLITDPSVIADQPRYVRLTKEYHDLEEILHARSEYQHALESLEESKQILSTETDEEMRELACEELDACTERIPTPRMPCLKSEEAQAVTRPLSLRATCSECTRNMLSAKDGSCRSRQYPKGLPADIRRSSALSPAMGFTAR